MAQAPIVGVTTYARNDRGRYTLPAEYVAAVRRAGGLPWLIPPGEPRWREIFERLDALLLTGGGDLDPAHYGGKDHPEIYGVDRTRDETEIALALAAVEEWKPTLAICRGCQVLNVALGGTLIEHLPDEVGDEVAHREEGPGTRTFHHVAIARGSRLAAIVGAEASEPSSSHHQALRDLARGLEVVARASDGTIEAVEMRSHPFLVAVQWHPENTAAEDPGQQRLFDALVAAARGAGARAAPGKGASMDRSKEER
jgi:putative glutamine amidotransferase